MEQNDITVGDFTAFLQFAASGTFSFDPADISAFFDKIRDLITQQGQMTAELDAQITFAEEILIAYFGNGGTVTVDINATIAALSVYPADTPLSETAEFAGLFEDLPGNPGDPGGDGDTPDYVVGDVGFKTVAVAFGEVETSIDGSNNELTITGAISITVDLDVTQRIAFTDGFLGFDFQGNAGQAYRLYEAAFDRDPDQSGLGFWIRQLDNDTTDLNEIAKLFLDSDEFQATYGAVDDSEFVAQLYLNILGRSGDSDGVEFWTGQLEEGVAREVLLARFSESGENQTNVQVEISGGIFYV